MSFSDDDDNFDDNYFYDGGDSDKNTMQNKYAKDVDELDTNLPDGGI